MNEILDQCAERLKGRPEEEVRARLQVCTEALTWLGTPYHSHGRIKGVGVDCATILAEVFSVSKLVPKIDLGDYAPDWHLHRDEEKYLAGIATYARPVDADLGDGLPGDIALFRFGRTISHGAIVLASPMVIHSYFRHGVILEDASNGELVGRFAGVWSVWGAHGR